VRHNSKTPPVRQPADGPLLGIHVEYSYSIASVDVCTRLPFVPSHSDHRRYSEIHKKTVQSKQIDSATIDSARPATSKALSTAAIPANH
jgi:hypothetical protein